MTTIWFSAKKGRNLTINHAVQTYEDLLALIDLRRNWRGGNIYVALGVQRMADTATSEDGYRKAIRQGHNMVSFRSLWLDIDAKDYGGSPDAVDAALEKFLKDSGMPEPTLRVRSGSGGLHVYWCFDNPISTDDWRPLAEALKACCAHHGLKIDPACTADAARVLRVPTTLNHKHNPPVPVELVPPTALNFYSHAALVGMLAKFAGKAKARTGTGPDTVAQSAWAQNFTENAEREWPRLSIDRIAVNCPMTAQTLADGGAGKSEPEWSQDMYLAAWTDDPTNAAHRLSQGHAGYVPADTDKKVAEKVAAISNGGLGWPSCASFKHAACKTCPLAAAGKSPITFGHQVTTAQPMQPAQVTDPLMPEQYWRNSNHHVLAATTFGAFDVLGYPVLDGGIDAVDHSLVIKTNIGGVDRWGSVNTSKQSGIGLCEALHKGTRNGIIINGDKKAAGSFIMAWMTHLQNTKRYIQPSSFGWTGRNFVFGDEVFTPTGPQSAYRGSSSDINYQRVGELQPWIDAMSLIYGNPALEIIVASAFASPLVALACDYSLTMAAYSHQSGYGKSTAMKLAQAVWGHPRTGMSMLDDTNNAVIKKTTDLKNLPIYWDEMKTAEQVDKVVQVVFAVAQGRSKARLSRDSSQMAIGSATTMLVVASNRSLASSIYRATEGTDAGGMRVFEIDVPPLVSSVRASDSETRVIRLNDNYGVAGAVYADYLVRNRAQVEKIIAAIDDQLETAFTFTVKERFWKNTMVTLMTGGYVANASGLTSFNMPAMQDFLHRMFIKHRGTLRDQSYTLASPTDGEGVLNEMMADIRGRNLLYTDIVPRPLGRPFTVQTKEFTDPGRVGDIWMQVGEKDGRILARRRSFDRWLIDHKYHPEQVLELLGGSYLITRRKASIGAGVPWLDAVKGRADCYDLSPLVPPVSHSPASPSASFGSPEES